MQTLSWCQRVVRISRNRENLTVIEFTTKSRKEFTVIELHNNNNDSIHSISRGISRGLQIFRLLLRPSATTTAYWRHKKRVYFGGLEMGLEKGSFNPSHLQPAQQELQNRGTKVNTVLFYTQTFTLTF